MITPVAKLPNHDKRLARLEKRLKAPARDLKKSRRASDAGARTATATVHISLANIGGTSRRSTAQLHRPLS